MKRILLQSCLCFLLALLFLGALQAQTSQQKVENVALRITSIAEAKLTSDHIIKEFEGKPLTGVVVNIVVSDAFTTLLFDTAIVTETFDGTPISPILIMLGDCGDRVDLIAVRKISLVGGQIVVGVNVFESNLSVESCLSLTPETDFRGARALGVRPPYFINLKGPSDLNREGSVRCAFKTLGSMQVAFIYQAQPDNLATLSLFGQTLRINTQQEQY